MTTDTASEFLSVAFDLEVERSGLLARSSEFLEVGRELQPSICFYRGSERVMMVTSRNTDSEATQLRAMMEILQLFTAMPNVESLLVTWHAKEVKLKDGSMAPAVLVILVKRSGAEAMVYPYVKTEDGHIAYDLDVELDPNFGRAYSNELSHAFAVYAFQWYGAGSIKTMVEWLSSKGHEIQFFGDWSMNNVDAKTHIPISETK